jgi:hypothetical protein
MIVVPSGTTLVAVYHKTSANMNSRSASKRLRLTETCHVDLHRRPMVRSILFQRPSMATQ